MLLGARDAERGRAAESKLNAEKLDARFVELDVNEPRTISLAASKIREEFGRLDVLVNNAGIVDSHDGLAEHRERGCGGAGDGHKLSWDGCRDAGDAAADQEVRGGENY